MRGTEDGPPIVTRALRNGSPPSAAMTRPLIVPRLACWGKTWSRGENCACSATALTKTTHEATRLIHFEMRIVCQTAHVNRRPAAPRVPARRRCFPPRRSVKDAFAPLPQCLPMVGYAPTRINHTRRTGVGKYLATYAE